MSKELEGQAAQWPESGVVKDSGPRQKLVDAVPLADGPPTQPALKPVDAPELEPRERPWDPSPSDAAALLSRYSRGERDFKGSRLAFSRFKACVLRWTIFDDSDLRRSDFEDADLGFVTLRRCNLHGVSFARASLEKAILTGATLREADLRGADLSSAELRGADLSFAVADLETRFPPNFHPKDEGIFVLGADREGRVATGDADDSGFTSRSVQHSRYVQVGPSSNSGGVVDITGDGVIDGGDTNPGLPPPPAVTAPLYDAFLASLASGERKFVNARLGGVRLVGSNLSGSVFDGACLHTAILTKANFRRASLRGADLRGADLQGANLVGADLRDADLTGADLRGANLSGARLPDGVRDVVRDDRKTRWPSARKPR